MSESSRISRVHTFLLSGLLLLVIGWIEVTPAVLPESPPQRHIGRRHGWRTATGFSVTRNSGILEPVAATSGRLQPLTTSSKASAALAGEPRECLHGVRIPFIANSGQIDPVVAYYAPTFAGTVYVTRDGQVVYSLPGELRPSSYMVRFSGRGPDWSLTETIVGGRARPQGADPASTGVNYFLGNDRARWKTGLPTFERVSLGEVWPRISVELQAHANNVEKVFTVEPGGDPSKIRMNVAGALWLRVDERGALTVGTGLGQISFTPPVVTQEHQGTLHRVRAAYELHGRQYGFRLGEYDPGLPVRIDPLLQATYLGSSGSEAAYAVAIHPTTGEVYVAGSTGSTSFPGTAGGAQKTNGGRLADAFVARLNPALTALNQATYLGGSGSDEAVLALAIHQTTGDVYVAGVTTSTDFPGTAGGAQTAFGGGNADAFVARLTAALTTLTQATYLGGSGPVSLAFNDIAFALAIHPTTGDVYVAGDTNSTDFPGTAGGAQAARGGGFDDAFVARLNATLTTLSQATYLGGSGLNDRCHTLAIHPTSGEVFVAGQTDSTDFPGTAGGAQPVNGGGGSFGPFDAFVARLNPTLTTLNQATYLGGSGEDQAFALAIHPSSSEVYVAGQSASTNFPGTAGGAQAATGGLGDAFVARLNSALTALNQSTYLGGNDRDSLSDLAIQPTSGEVYAAGDTSSTNFPGTTGGAQAANGGFGDAFVARLNPALTTLEQATYLGGSGSEGAADLAIQPTSGEVYAAGSTTSTNFPGTAGGAQTATGGGSGDAFVARFSPDLAAGPEPTPTPTPVPPTVTLTPHGPASVVPTLSFAMLALLGVALAAIGFAVSRRMA